MILSTIRTSFRYILRLFRRDPQHSLAVVLMLGIGIGANALMIDVVYRTLIEPLPYPNSGSLVSLMRTDDTGRIEAFSPKLTLRLQEEPSAFAGIVAFQYESFNVVTQAGVNRVQGMSVTPNLFSVLSSSPIKGRTFNETNDGQSGNSVVISDNFRQKYLADVPDVIGSVIKLNGVGYLIEGVMPESFRFDPSMGIASGLSFSERVDLWIPLRLDPSNSRNYFILVGRLRTGVSLQQANAELEARGRLLRQEFGDAARGLTLRAVSLKERAISNVRPAILIVFGASGLLLIMSCANVGNILISRVVQRQSEFALRMALGAQKWRLIGQLVWEAFAHCVLGGIIGLTLFMLIGRAVWQAFPGGMVRIETLELNGVVIISTAAMCIVLSVVLGVVSAQMLAERDISSLIAEQGRGNTLSRRARAIRSMFVALQISISFALLLGALLIARSTIRLLSVDRGFKTAGVLTGQLALPESQYAKGDKVAALLTQFLDQLKAQPGVSKAGLISILPLGGIDRSGPGFQVDGPQPIAIPTDVTTPLVSGGYFETMRIPLLAGRYLTDADTEVAQGVVVVSATFARRFFPKNDALGASLSALGGRIRVSIVGVVGDVRHWGFREPAKPMLYFPFRQAPFATLPSLIRPTTVVALGVGDQLPPASVLTTALSSSDPLQAVSNIRSMDEVVKNSILKDRVLLWLVGGFSLAALILAIFGVYAVVSRAVIERSRELGVRIAIGATPGNIISLIMRQQLKWTGVGLIMGVLLVIPLTQYLSGELYANDKSDPLNLLAVALLLVCAVLGSALPPTIQAGRIDPSAILKRE